MPEKAYNHGEAFRHMTYQTKDKRETEILWNSRDGVTPFVIHSRSGKEMHHVGWRSDVFDPSYKPVPGDRIFVDATRELVADDARKYVEKHWELKSGDISMSNVFEGQSKEQVIEHFIAEWTQPGSPWLVSVGDDGKLTSA